MRAFLVAILTLALFVPAAAAQTDPAQHPPKMPDSTKGTKRCGKASRFGSTFKLYLVKGKSRISCRRARKIVRKPPFDLKRWQYFDWTKAGNGPWTDHFPKQPSPEDAPMARKVAELGSALGSPFAGLGGDRTSLMLHPEDEALIQTVAEVNPRTVVAIMAGSAVITEAWRDKVAAILLLGYPGQEGGHAFADVLLGHANPSGKLPFVVPKSADDLPFFDKDATEITYDLWHGYRKLERDNATPAFPFGFGLSYTAFTLSDLRLAQDTIATDGSVMAAVDVTNTGDVGGEEVVQLYVSARNSTVERAPKELKAFTKVALEPGERRTVRLAVPAASLAYYDEKNGWIVEPGNYEVILGRHSLDDEALRARFAIERPTPH